MLRRYLDRRVARAALLAGGDDYELCFTAPRLARARVVRSGRRAGVALTAIGRVHARVRNAPRLVVRAADGAALRLERGGFDHFG